MIKNLWNRIQMIVGKGILSSVNDETKIQLIKASFLSNEVHDKVERIQNYGFTSNPPKGSEVVTVFVGGNRNNGVAIAIDNSKSRKKGLQNKEVAIYHENGNFIHFKNDGSISIKASDGVIVDGDLQINGDVDITGELSVTGKASAQNFETALTDLNGFYADYLLHIHSGVTVGSGVTGALVP